MPDQQNWRSCNKCGAVYFGGLGTGRCAAGGPHDDQGGWYAMPTAQPAEANSQGNWRWCSKCQVLFFAGSGAGSCPAGGGHDATTSSEYFVATSTYASPTAYEDGWHWCAKCQGLNSHKSGVGVCPAGGGHTQTGSGEYIMKTFVRPMSKDPPAEQQSWRRCSKCQATFYGALGTGHCAAGGPHDSQNSGWYAVPTVQLVGVNNQGNWRWCSKCQVLFFAGSGAGSCPAGGGHDATGSSEYFIATSTYESYGQDGWRWCKKCQGLNFSGAGAGVCPAGGGHEQSGSSNYSMKLSVVLDVMNVGSQHGEENSTKSAKLPLAGNGTVTFIAQALHDVVINLGDGPTPVYQIVIGGRGNTQTVIRRNFLGSLDVVATVDKGLLSPGGANQLWISLDPETRTIKVGRGAVGQDVILSYVDDSEAQLRLVQNIVFSALGSLVTYANIATTDFVVQPYIETQCKLIVDYDANHQPQSQFEVVLIARRADGSLHEGAQIKVIAAENLSISREENGAITNSWIDPFHPILLTASAMGRCRFTISPPKDLLVLPVLMAQSDAMASLQWVAFSPDVDLHAQLAQVTAEKLLATPPGKPGPLLPANRETDATALAQAIGQLMKPCLNHDLVAAPPTATAGPMAFNLIRKLIKMATDEGGSVVDTAVSGGSGVVNTVVSGGSNVVNTIGGAVSSAAGTTASAAAIAEVVAKRTTSTAISVSNAIASQAKGPIGTAAQYLDTTGAAAQVLINNADIAVARPVEHFATNTIAAAQQLAIDISNGITVIALVVENGVTTLVKTVVTDVDSAGQMTVAFCKRVGLEVKAVIDFLAALFDWDAILRSQAQIQQAWDSQMASLAQTVSAERAKFPDQIRALESKITARGSETDAPANASPTLSLDSSLSSSLGGTFGFLMDKLTSHLTDGFGLPSNLGLGSLESLLSAIPASASNDLAAFSTAFQSSPLKAALQDPQKFLRSGPQSLFVLTAPLVTSAVKLLAAATDGILAIAGRVMTEVQKLLQHRIVIPLFTDFIEKVVFRGKQQLTVQSLITLLAAALVQVATKLYGQVSSALASNRALSFAETEPDKTAFWLAAGAAMCNVLQVILSAAVLVYESTQKVRESAYRESVEWINAILGLVGAVLPGPYSPSSENLYKTAQWLSWTLNLVASISAIGDLSLKKVTPDNHYAKYAAGCGVGMLGLAGVADGLALGLNQGDLTRNWLDLWSQTASAGNNFGPIAGDGGIAVGIVFNTASFGLGVATLKWWDAHPELQPGWT